MITILADIKTPRLLYTTEVIFKQVLGLEVKVMVNKEKFLAIDFPKINYSSQPIEGILRILPAELLFEEGIKKQRIKMKLWKKLPCFFLQNKEEEIPFDLFAASFYLFSRYEEYLSQSKDEHGRFDFRESLAQKAGFMQRPLVNLWATELLKIIKKRYPNYSYPQKEFKAITTLDIDMAYSYRHKGIWRNLGGFTRELLNLDLKKIEKRYRVLTEQEEDPLDNFDYQHQVHQQSGIEVIYFLLMADHGKFDKNIDYDNEAFIDLIQKLSADYTVGLHPGYASNGNIKKLKQELERLEEIVLAPITRSRQHFLKLDIRETYKRLLKHGILEDHSMGYSETTGFRASICSPFHFFDLEKNEKTPLILYPFAAMDVALNRFMKLKPLEAKTKLRQLIQEVYTVKGTFISVFHNESLSDFDNWKGWREVYEFMLNEMKAGIENKLPALTQA